MIKTALPELIAFAERVTLANPAVEILQNEQLDLYPPLAHVIDAHLLCRRQRKALLLPNLRADGNETIGIFTDYSGESNGRYLVYSVLVCGWNHSYSLFSEMEVIRAQHGLADKEISFKDFRYGPIRRGLRDYLKALDDLVFGLLYTLVVEKSISTLFRSGQLLPHEVLAGEGYRRWSLRSAEKLLRVTHTAAYLTALLSKEGQKILWMTDHDDISANERMHLEALQVFQRVLPIYSRHAYGLISGAVPFSERGTGFLDLLSATDIVAGSLAFYFANHALSAATATATCAEQVLRWLQHDGLGLKKMTVVVDRDKNGLLKAADLCATKLDIPPHVTIVPIRV